MKEKINKGATISYRPTEEVEALFDRYCSGAGSMSKTQLIEIAFQFLLSQGETNYKETIKKFLFSEFESSNKKGEQKKSA